MRLPAVLSRNDLPLPELQAARLDGELYAIDECFSPVDEPEQGRHRAASLAVLLPARLIAEQRTAAWIHGALDLPPARHELCVDIAARVQHATHLRFVVREVVIGREDLVEIAGIPVTNPVRTVVDLARFSPVFGSAEHRMIAGLAGIGGFGIDECRAMLDRRRNLPGKQMALERIRLSLGCVE